jgi:hypothetical protein
MNLRCLAWSSAAFAILCLSGCKPTEAKPSTTYSLSSAYSSYGTFRLLTQQELSQIWEDAETLNPTGEGSRLAFMLTKETPQGPEFRTFDAWGKRSPLIAQRSRDIIGKAILLEAGSLSNLRWHSISMAPYSIDARAGAGASDRDFLNGVMKELEKPPQQLASFTEDSILFLVTFVGYEGFDQLPFLVRRSDIPKLPRFLRSLVTKSVEHSSSYEGLRKAEGARVAKLKGQRAKEIPKNLMVTMKNLLAE